MSANEDRTTTGQQAQGTPPARVAMVTVDCHDPRIEADFWSAALGGTVAHADDEYAMVVAEGTTLGFGRVEGHRPPSWPDHDGAKQFHLDLAVPDVMAAQEVFRGLGATVPEFQPGGERWRVLLDPAGHPFCLTAADAWG